MMNGGKVEFSEPKAPEPEPPIVNAPDLGFGD